MIGSKPKHRKITRLIQYHWNERSANFDERLEFGLHSDAQRQAWLNLLSKVAGDPPRRVLEAGCGTGMLTILLAELGHKVTGVDFAAQMLDRAKRKAHDAGVAVELRREDAAALADPGGTYDLVVARHVVWLLPDPAAAIREWLRVLRPDGRLAIIEGTFLTEEQKPEPSSARKTLAAMVRTAGRAISYCAKPAQWGTVPQRLRARCNGLLERLRTRHDHEAKYQEAHQWLPFYGGPSAAQLVSLLEGQGLRDVVVEPLMDNALWGEAPPFPRYLVVGRR